MRYLAFALCWVRDVDSFLPFIDTQYVQWACIECIFGLCRHFVCTGNVKTNLPVTVHPLLYADCTFKSLKNKKISGILEAFLTNHVKFKIILIFINAEQNYISTIVIVIIVTYPLGACTVGARLCSYTIKFFPPRKSLDMKFY